MSLDNFLVRPKRRYVEKYVGASAWARLDADTQHELVEHVAGLPSAVVDDDLEAKQFDLLVFRTELALLRVDPAFHALKSDHRDRSLLEDLANVPMVAAEMALIQEVQTDDYWQDVTLPMLETVRRRLRALVKLIEHEKQPSGLFRLRGPRPARLPRSTCPAFRSAPTWTPSAARRACFSSRTRTTSPILKLQRNEPLTPTDLAELERIFVEAGVDAGVARRAAGRRRSRPLRPFARRARPRGGQAAPSTASRWTQAHGATSSSSSIL